MRVLSSRCSMWKLTRVPRAPEYRRTGSEMRPKVRYPVQTEAAMAHSCLVLGELNCRMRCALRLWPGCERVVYTGFAKQVSGHGFSRAEKRITLNCHPERSGREPA